MPLNPYPSNPKLPLTPYHFNPEPGTQYSALRVTPISLLNYLTTQLLSLVTQNSVLTLDATNAMNAMNAIDAMDATNATDAIPKIYPLILKNDCRIKTND